MKFFQKYRDKKAAKIQERKARQERSRQAAIDELDMATMKMLSSPCPINGMSPCVPACVHWRAGGTAYFPPWNGSDGFHYAVRPTCRLWGNK